MDDELQELRSELNALAVELLDAQRELRHLRRGRSLSRHWTAILSAAALTTLSLASWTAFAQKGQPSYAVRAPFWVLDKNKRPIFVVAEGSKERSRGLHLFNAGGTAVVQMFDFQGGHIKVNSAGSDKDNVTMAAGARLGLSLTNAGTPRVFMGEGTKGSGAAIEKTDHGVVEVFAAGRAHSVAALTVTDQRGTVAVYDAMGKAIAHLAESDKIPLVGRVTVAPSGSDGVFSGGATGDGGEACRSRGAALECLGPDLPLSIHKTRKAH